MDPGKKSLNFVFPTKYVIPKSLKFSHWPSKPLRGVWRFWRLFFRRLRNRNLQWWLRFYGWFIHPKFHQTSRTPIRASYGTHMTDPWGRLCIFTYIYIDPITKTTIHVGKYIQVTMDPSYEWIPSLEFPRRKVDRPISVGYHSPHDEYPSQPGKLNIFMEPISHGGPVEDEEIIHLIPPEIPEI